MMLSPTRTYGETWQNLTNEELLQKADASICSLKIHACFDLDDQTLVALSKKMLQLEALSLAYMSEVSELGLLPALSALHNLRSLELNCFAQAGDAMLLEIAQKASQLDELNILNCNYVSPEGTARALQLVQRS